MNAFITYRETFLPNYGEKTLWIQPTLVNLSIYLKFLLLPLSHTSGKLAGYVLISLLLPIINFIIF